MAFVNAKRLGLRLPSFPKDVSSPNPTVQKKRSQIELNPSPIFQRFGENILNQPRDFHTRFCRVRIQPVILLHFRPLPDQINPPDLPPGHMTVFFWICPIRKKGICLVQVFRVVRG